MAPENAIRAAFLPRDAEYPFRHRVDVADERHGTHAACGSVAAAVLR
jgi:hypothetical protein